MRWLLVGKWHWVKITCSVKESMVRITSSSQNIANPLTVPSGFTINNAKNGVSASNLTHFAPDF